MTKNISHQKTVLKAGTIAILVNLFLAVFKVAIGFVSNSIAIMSDALHGLIDTVSGIIIIVSEKLGSSQKFAKNHEKIEHYGALIIAVIIIVVGVHVAVESIEEIISHEKETEYSVPIIIVLVASIIGKLLLGRYLKNTGEKVKSDTLVASSVETINDSIISAAVLLSAFVYIIWHVDVEAYVSIIISIIIIKLGLGLIFPGLFKHHH